MYVGRFELRLRSANVETSMNNCDSPKRLSAFLNGKDVNQLATEMSCVDHLSTTSNRLLTGGLLA